MKSFIVAGLIGAAYADNTIWGYIKRGADWPGQCASG